MLWLILYIIHNKTAVWATYCVFTLSTYTKALLLFTCTYKQDYMYSQIYI